MFKKKKKRHLDGGQGRGYSETRHPTLKLSQMLVVLKSKFHEFGLFGINFLCSIRNICSGFLQDTFQIKKEKKTSNKTELHKLANTDYNNFDSFTIGRSMNMD